MAKKTEIGNGEGEMIPQCFCLPGKTIRNWDWGMGNDPIMRLFSWFFPENSTKKPMKGTTFSSRIPDSSKEGWLRLPQEKGEGGLF